jgi:hypothetical protein
MKPPRRDTRALSQSGMFGRKALLCLAGAEKQTARTVSAYALYACFFFCKWEV